jgi:hypothetical protein
MKRLLSLGLLALAGVCSTAETKAFCGFYVAQANTQLFNQSSKVALARDGERTYITMASDYVGTPSEFALVIPVPTVPKRNEINVVPTDIFGRIDAYSAPRLVEYHDPDPCAPQYMEDRMAMSGAMPAPAMTAMKSRARELGVKIEARYEVGEYDILILSAKQSTGLVTWLQENRYKIPQGAEPVIGSYLKQGMKFFVAKVNLKRHKANGTAELSPIQVAYTHRKFMLPLRLGTVNARGPQDLFIFAITKGGRVETTNYRTIKLPSNMDVPIYVKDEFPTFYKAVFDHQVKMDNGRAVYLEYAWTPSNCDPCAGDPPSTQDLVTLGARWLTADPGDVQPMQKRRGGFMPQYYGQAFFTRLHVRYTRKTFPEDLMLQETSDMQTFQGRYVLRHPYTGAMKCPAAQEYRKSLVERWDQEAENLSQLTGWDEDQIKSKMRRLRSSGGGSPGMPRK